MTTTISPTHRLSAVTATARPVAALAAVVGQQRHARLLSAADDFRTRFAGHTIWTVSSTASGGGVAEMLQGLVGYVRDLDIDIRWLVIGADPGFFAVTKHLHHLLHGFPGRLRLGPDTAAHYEDVLADNAQDLIGRVHPGDIVLLHDPQTAGLAPWLTHAGVHVVWRSHVGTDLQNAATRDGWAFLRPYLQHADAYVFSRRAFIPAWLPAERTRVIPPSIDPFAPKNRELSPDTVRALLGAAGLIDAPVTAPPVYPRRDGGSGMIARRATVVAESLPGPDEPLVVQVSRWDPLKDMAGVMRSFAEYVAPHAPGRLMLAGPALVSDDPEGALVRAACVQRWRGLPRQFRERIVLASLPMDDVDENAVLVNALQRHAAVVTQKSLAEGFGLTVAEAMWKGRPVLASAVGGIPDQITEGTGVLLPDPSDLSAFGVALCGLLSDPATRERLGAAAHERVRTAFVGDLHLSRYAELLTALLGVVPGG
ncbi:glycosyltransferase [Krasilnikovia sp. MM14-A1004]|uniref:glycosyltransferase n=1 Tax=Krasilnikovia sp. MM14-A1004 TaxID=3373541 RepID=UPI00399D1A77